MEESIQKVAEGITNGAITVAIANAVGVLLGSHQLVVAKAEDAGIAVVDEGHRPGATEAIADLEESLALENNKREAFIRKADATCWVIERLRAEASYHSSQSKRFSALAKREDNRADALESTLIHLLSRLDPSATSHHLTDHHLSSRTTEAIEIDDPDLLPPELVTTQTTTTANKTSIKARIRSLISTATSGLPKAEAAHLAFSLSSTAVPGARLIKRRHWSIT